MLSNELRDQQEGKATRWAAFFDFQRAVAPCLNGCLFPTALISSCLNCRSLGGAEICLVSKRMFIPDGTPVLVTEYYILTRRNIETLNMVVCSATNVESCLCLKAPREFLSFLCFISEQIRSGMGAIPIVLLVIDKVKKGIGATKLQRMFSCIIIAGICVAVLLFYFGDYILEQNTRIEKYQEWIFTQFSSESMYNRFVITGIQDIWKLPFCFILYAFQPLNTLDHSYFSSIFFSPKGSKRAIILIKHHR